MEITELLGQWRAGDIEARNKVVHLVSQDLQRMAAGLLRREYGPRELQPTELVNESMLRLLGLKEIDWQDRAHFFALSATLMRRTLVDEARKKQANKRAGEHVTLLTGHLGADQANTQGVRLMALNEALEELREISADRAQIVELKYFAGLSTSEIAFVLDISESTVKRSWRVARAWLELQLQD